MRRKLIVGEHDKYIPVWYTNLFLRLYIEAADCKAQAVLQFYEQNTLYIFNIVHDPINQFLRRSASDSAVKHLK